MQRRSFKDLLSWKNSPRRKPLLLMGARQVGKTWLMQEFGKQAFQKVAYVRFDTNAEMRRSFERDFNVKRLLSAIQLDTGVVITPEDTLMIFDEIQECPHALTALKYFCEEAPQYPLVAAGSLLGVATHVGTGWPVGKIDTLNLYPMSFTEFLTATGNELLADALYRREWDVLSDFAPKMEDLLRHYYYVGGMPAVVDAFVQHGDFSEVRVLQQQLLADYRRDFSKHAPANEVPKLSLIWDSLPAQLAKENKKFVCKEVREGFRMKHLEVALQWLLDAGMAEHVMRVSKPALPLSGYQEAAFKAFVLDVGLLTAQCELPARVLLEKNRVFTEFKGALTEQYVQQQLRAEMGITPYYWTAAGGTAEIDFLFAYEGQVVPLEVKAETNLKAKSLMSYCRRYAPALAVRCSMSGYSRQPLTDGGMLLNLPLWGISQLTQECREMFEV